MVEELGSSYIRWQKDHGREGDENRGDAFKDEDPSPSSQSADTVHLDNGGRKKT